MLWWGNFGCKTGFSLDAKVPEGVHGYSWDREVELRGFHPAKVLPPKVTFAPYPRPYPSMPSYPHVQPLNGREINYEKRFNTYMTICTEQPRCLHPQRSEALKTEAKLKKLGIKRDSKKLDKNQKILKFTLQKDGIRTARRRSREAAEAIEEPRGDWRLKEATEESDDVEWARADDVDLAQLLIRERFKRLDWAEEKQVILGFVGSSDLRFLGT